MPSSYCRTTDATDLVTQNHDLDEMTRTTDLFECAEILGRQRVVVFVGGLCTAHENQPKRTVLLAQNRVNRGSRAYPTTSELSTCIFFFCKPPPPTAPNTK